MRLCFLLCLLSVGTSWAQTSFSVWQPDYRDFSLIDSMDCPEFLRQKQQNLYLQIEQYEYQAALDFCDSLEKAANLKACPPLAQIRAVALHKAGDWKSCINLLDKAIKNYGPDPETIYRRAFLLAQMGDKGLYNARGWYLGRGFEDTLDSKLFQTQCYQAALHDLKYLVQRFQMSADDAYMIAYLHRQIEDFTGSVAYARQLLRHPKLRGQARDLLIDNYLDLTEYDEAKQLLLLALEEYPRESSLYTRLYRAYTGLQDSMNAQKAERSFYYIQWVPQYLDLAQNKANFKHLKLFNTNENLSVKQKHWRKLQKSWSTDSLARIVVSLIYSGALSDTPLEKQLLDWIVAHPEAAQQPLVGLWYSKPPLPVLHLITPILQQQYPDLAWDLFSAYLPQLEKIPFNQIPPPIPSALVELRPSEAPPILLANFKGNSAHRYLYRNAFGALKIEQLQKALEESDWSEQAGKQLIQEVFGEKGKN